MLLFLIASTGNNVLTNDNIKIITIVIKTCVIKFNFKIIITIGSYSLRALSIHICAHVYGLVHIAS